MARRVLDSLQFRPQFDLRPSIEQTSGLIKRPVGVVVSGTALDVATDLKIGAIVVGAPRISPEAGAVGLCSRE
jgi:hypothetical protein